MGADPPGFPIIESNDTLERTNVFLISGTMWSVQLVQRMSRGLFRKTFTAELPTMHPKHTSVDYTGNLRAGAGRTRASVSSLPRMMMAAFRFP